MKPTLALLWAATLTGVVPPKAATSEHAVADEPGSQAILELTAPRPHERFPSTATIELRAWGTFLQDPPTPIPHPADVAPPEGHLDTTEWQAYVSSWLSSVRRDEFPLGYVTRAGFLFAHGGSYQFDPKRAPVPLAWVPVFTNEPPRTPALWQGPSTAILIIPAIPDSPTRHVSLELLPAPGTQAQAAQLYLPAEAGVVSISDGGVHVPEAQIVRWGPFLDDQSRSLTVELDSNQYWPNSGLASFDGSEFEPLPVPGGPEEPSLRLGGLQRLANGDIQVAVVDSLSGGPNAGTCHLEVSTDLHTWRRITSQESDKTGPWLIDQEAAEEGSRFYRVVRE
jgi:hypothetical protein